MLLKYLFYSIETIDLLESIYYWHFLQKLKINSIFTKNLKCPRQSREWRMNVGGITVLISNPVTKLQPSMVWRQNKWRRINPKSPKYRTKSLPGASDKPWGTEGCWEIFPSISILEKNKQTKTKHKRKQKTH